MCIDRQLETYRTDATGDDAVKGEGVGNAMEHATPARVHGIIARLLFFCVRKRVVGSAGERDMRRASIAEGIDHFD